MEAPLGGKTAHHHLYGPVVSDLNLNLQAVGVGVGKRTMEWDLNDWKWDGDLFTATPLSLAPSDCRSRQLFPLGSSEIIPTNTRVSNNSFSSDSDEIIIMRNVNGGDKGKKRRGGFDCGDDDEELNNDEAAVGSSSLHLKLGGEVYSIGEGNAYPKNGKKTKVMGHSSTSNRAVCQVQDCRADLSNAKDYHRRHKVCDVHSKAVKALVGNVMQRFCQQCSRFHVLQEFDEGKRSCRRRLAGHNRRRRKTHPENGETGGIQLNDDGGSNYLLISLLRILSNIHSTNESDQAKDQDLLSHLLRSLAGLADILNERNLTSLLSASQDLRNAGPSVMINPGKSPTAALPLTPLAEKTLLRDDDQSGIVMAKSTSLTREESLGATVVKAKMNNIDLNNVYDDSEDCMESAQGSDGPIIFGKTSPSWMYQDPNKYSPPQASGNSGSTSTLSPSSSSGEAQSRTDRIVFKLFGKDPSDFPNVLRQQILDWLSNSPTDIESYIRPGCVILTVYLRMDKGKWDELFFDFSDRLNKLLALGDYFWKTGWIYTRVLHRVAFIYDGHIVLDTPLPHQKVCRVVTVKPIAVCASTEVEFSVKGINLSFSTTRLLCAIEGKYLVHERCADAYDEHAETRILSFTCTIPDVTGRGFIEIEDHGLSSSFFPFIVAETDVCSEIRTLESIIEAVELSAGDGLQGSNESLEARDLALDFIHEMGWLLHRYRLRSRLGHLHPNSGNPFPFQRFRWLLEYSMEHDWCAVVKMLLNVLFSNDIIKNDENEKHSTVEEALLDVGLLHRAVRRNCRSMVEVLLRYRPIGGLNTTGSAAAQNYLFRPDAKGPGGLTPLHIAAGRDGAEHILDALTDDPGTVGLEAWRSARDSTGLTPNDYACLRGHYSYIHLVQKKIGKMSAHKKPHVVVDIPPENTITKQKADSDFKSKNKVVTGLETEMTLARPSQAASCRQCEQKLAYGRIRTSLSIYKPAMLSMVAIAAVCVCVALLFKSSPEVVYVFRPFRWENLEYGSS
ncbi:OLC1v1020717C1 [Oldenlandia corymbosa var. corymbosa]|uniref:OLC1v1020717C1 n=1 Tax=Oldenlandia corymbosa var. corymbosa TaxID=529605 RepID=A0AAV1EHA1_OLDCO|nr:OLC1v1020717C1 [Oldenlandia corymbosa var. corymbosa]